MLNPTHQKDRALQLLARQGIMRLSNLKAEGVHAQTISRLIAEGTVIRTS